MTQAELSKRPELRHIDAAIPAALLGHILAALISIFMFFSHEIVTGRSQPFRFLDAFAGVAIILGVVVLTPLLGVFSICASIYALAYWIERKSRIAPLWLSMTIGTFGIWFFPLFMIGEGRITRLVGWMFEGTTNSASMLLFVATGPLAGFLTHSLFRRALRRKGVAF